VKRAALAVAGLLLALHAAAPAPASAADRGACAKGRTAVKVARDGRSFPARGRGGRTICIRSPRAIAPKRLLGGRAFAPRGRKVRRVVRSAKVRRLARLAGTVSAKALGGAARAARRVESSTRVETGPDGERVVTELTRTTADDREAGRGDEASVTARKGAAEVTSRQRRSSFVNRCPDAGGRVPGEWATGYTQEISAAQGGMRVIVHAEVSEAATIEGHNGDDGRLVDFGYAATGSVEVRARVVSLHGGRTLERSPTRVYRVSSSGTGIDPRALPASSAKALETRQFGGRGPAGDRLTPAEIQRLLSQLVAIEHDVTHDGAEALLAAERGWFDRAACMRAELAPGALELAPGDSAAVSVAVRHAVEPVEVPMHLTAERFHGAGVTPAEADAAPGAPARFTLAAPPARWPSQANPGLRIAGVSPRGRVEGSIAAGLKDKDVRFRITFTGTVDSSSSYRVDGSASAATTGDHTTHGSFRLVWPDAHFAVDARNAALVQGCGGAASCSDGTLTFDSQFRDDDPNRSYRRDDTCHAGGVSPGFRGDAVFAVNTPALPGDPVPLVPGVRFLGFGPNLGFDVPCTEVVTQDGSSTTTEHGFAGALDNQSGFACRRQDLAAAQYFAQADFHVSESVVLHDDAFEIAVGNGPGFSSSCNDGDDYTSSSWAFKWSGMVSFVRLPG
jgi:hypothetical protein